MGFAGFIAWFIWAGACAIGFYTILPEYRKETVKEFFHIKKS